MRYGPEGDRVLYVGEATGSDDAQVYLYDLRLGTTPRQLTLTGNHGEVAWSPDGTQALFGRATEGRTDLYLRSLVTDDPAVPVTNTPEVVEWEPDWVDDTTVVYRQTLGMSGPGDLWILDPTGEREARPYLESEANLENPAVSPDGRYIAYSSGELGIDEVFVRRFPQPGEATRVSFGLGGAPRWTPDGRGLYFFAPGSAAADALPALRLAHVSLDPVFTVDSVTQVLGDLPTIFQWDIHPDGSRGIFIRPPERGGPDESGRSRTVRHHVVVNWLADLRRRMEN